MDVLVGSSLAAAQRMGLVTAACGTCDINTIVVEPESFHTKPTTNSQPSWIFINFHEIWQRHGLYKETFLHQNWLILLIFL